MILPAHVSGRGEPVLFLHGWNGCGSHLLRDVPPGFLSRHSCYSLDLPGYGMAKAMPVPERLSELVEFVRRTMECVGAHHVVGVCMGGVLAAEYAARHPARVRTVTLVETPFHFPAVLAPLLARKLGPALLALALKAACWAPGRPLVWGRHEYPEAFFESFAEADASVSCDYLRLLLKHKRAFGKAAWDAIAGRVFRIRGESSPRIIEMAWGRRVSLNFQELVLPGAGHFPMVENTAAFFSVLERIQESF